MYLSINIWLWFIGIWAVSQIIFSILSRSRGLIRGMFNILLFFGVFVHEFSHLVFCFIFRVPTNGMRFQFIDRREDMVRPGGAVRLAEYSRMSMMQALMVGIAPLFISTFLFMGCLDVMLRFETTFEVQIFIFILAISIVFAAAPSQADISHIFRAAGEEPLQSFFQFMYVVVSLVISLFLVDLSGIILPLEVLYYVSYFTLTIIIYSIIVLLSRIIRVTYRHFIPVENYSPKQIQRKRHKPKKPPKHEEGSW